MSPDLRLSEVRFSPAPTSDVAAGLLGFVTCVVNGALRLDGLGLRRTRAGELRLSWPAREDAAGRRHAVVRPITDGARRALEAEVFRALGLPGAAP